MNRTRKLVIILCLIFLGLSNYIYASVFFQFSTSSSTGISQPDIILLPGTVGTNTVYSNGTSASYTVDSFSTNFFPQEYDVSIGQYVSGSTPSSINTLDSDYFTVSSAVSDTSSQQYFPSTFNLIGGTSVISGTISDVFSDNGAYLTLESYLSDNYDIEELVDNSSSDVDSSVDKGFNRDIIYQQVGPDYKYDVLWEQFFGNYYEDYVDSDSSDVDSSSDVGNLFDFTNMQSQSTDYSNLVETTSGISLVNSFESWSAVSASSHSFGYNLQNGADNYRLVVVGVSWEDAEASASARVTFDGIAMTEVATVTVGSGYSAYTGLWYMNESLLPMTSGTKTVNVTVSESITREIYVTVAEYEGVAQSAPIDTATDSNEAAGNTEVTLTVADEGSILVAVGVQGDTFSWGNTNNLVNLQDQLLTSSGGALGHLTNASIGDLVIGWNSLGTREGMVGAVWSPLVNYQLDQEIQWSQPVDYLEGAELALKTGSHTVTEDTSIQVWNSTASQWDTLGNLTANTWNNYTISSYLSGSDLTIRFIDTVSFEDDTKDAWQIIAAFIQYLGVGSNEDLVDNDSSNVDSTDDFGTHSSFISQQSGVDSIYDFLTESSAYNITLIDAESFEDTWPPAGWASSGNWNAETDQAFDSSYSADCDGKTSGVLDTISLDCSDAAAVYVSFWFIDDNLDNGDFLLQFWDGSQWDTIQDMNGYSEDVWHHWEQKVTNSQYLIGDFQIRFNAVGINPFEHIYVDLVDVKKEIQNSKLDLEIQWTNLDYYLPYSELCIYTGSTGAEDIKIEVWNISSSKWESLLSDLNENSWNNISISNWVTSSTFTIRYLDGNQTGDSVQDQWQIDVALIHLWSNETAQFAIDLEYQWTNLEYWELNEELCIYGGVMGEEDILVDVWYRDAWNNLFMDLSLGWNNISITSYLDSSTLTIRLRGATDLSDAIRDQWQIDVSLIHVWGPEYTAEIELLGNSNLYECTQIDWLVDSSWTNESVRVELQLYNHSAIAYPSSGDGYINYINTVADVDETKNQVISSDPSNFRNDTSWWSIKITGKTNTQFNLNLDYLLLDTTYNSEFTAQTEFIFTDITDSQSPHLNFSTITHNSVDGADITIQIWNYTTSSYALSGQGFLSYFSTGQNNKQNLNISINPSSLINNSYAKIRITSTFNASQINEDQYVNYIHLLQDPIQKTSNYALRVSNQGSETYNIRLISVNEINISRLINCTIKFNATTQVQVIDGVITQDTGAWLNILPMSNQDIIIIASSVNPDTKSIFEIELEARKNETGMVTKYPVFMNLE